MTKIAHATCFESQEGKPHLFLCTPSYDGRVGQAYTVSLATSLTALKEAGYGVDYCLLGHNCHVDDARNALVRQFMMTDCSQLIFLDADIGWRPEDLVSLASYPRDVVAGVYPKKTDEVEYPVSVAPGTALYEDSLGLVEVLGVPTGFLKISRDALILLHKTHGGRKYIGQDHEPGTIPFTILFERTYEGGSRWSGDYAFCRKWAETGGHIYVDPKMKFLHEGTKEWTGSLGDYWKEKHGLTKVEKEHKLRKAIEDLRAGCETPQTMVDLISGWGNPWGAGLELAQACVDLGRQATGPILECGSGLTTLILAAVSTQPVISLEHEPIWGTYIQKTLEKYGLKADIRCAPLVEEDGIEFYHTGSLPDDIALVVCDGPPRDTKGGRKGLAKLMPLIQQATIILDDPAGDTIQSLNEAFDKLGHGALEFIMMGSIKPIAVSKVVSHA